MANSSLTTSMDEQHAPITVHLEFPGYDAPQLRFCGGFGDIYHTTQQSVLRPVCIKCLRTGDESPLIRLLNLTHQQEAIDSLVKLKEQFEQEVEITVSLSTSRYVPVVYDRGLTKITISKGGESGSLDWPYAVMEWIDGDQLDVFLTADDGPWPSGSDRRFAELSDEWQHRLLTIFTEIARALKDAHKQGIAHLDVTARNVMLKDSREVKLIDWGLAQRIGSCSEGKKGVAASGWGSADCMPSEQDIAFPREPLGFAIDVYNLGSIGYFLLTGKQLYTAITTDRNFAAKEMQTQIQCQYYHQTFYEELRRSGAPAFWVDLITQCFQLLPQSHSNRYKTAGEVVDAIEIYLAEQDRRERDSENRVATFRMRARWSALAVFLFLAVLIATSWALVARTNELRAKDQAVAATNATLEAELESNCFQLQQQLTSAQANWFKGNRKKAKITALNVLSQLEAQVQAHPTHRPSRRLLACTYGNVGDMLAYSYLPNMKSFNEWKDAIVVFFGPPLEENARNALEEGLGYLDRAMTGLQELKADWPDPPDGFALDLALVHIDRSFVLAYLHCFTESLMDCDQAILTHPDRSEIILLTIFRTGVLRAAERQQSKLPWSRPPHAEHAKALKLAAYLAEAEGVSAEAVYNAACAHALAASAAESDGERKQREDKAMDFLARIAKQGYFRNVLKKNELLTDPDLNSLRHRADFNDLSHATSPAQ